MRARDTGHDGGAGAVTPELMRVEVEVRGLPFSGRGQQVI